MMTTIKFWSLVFPQLNIQSLTIKQLHIPELSSKTVQTAMMTVEWTLRQLQNTEYSSPPIVQTTTI